MRAIYIKYTIFVNIIIILLIYYTPNINILYIYILIYTARAKKKLSKYLANSIIFRTFVVEESRLKRQRK